MKFVFKVTLLALLLCAAYFLVLCYQIYSTAVASTTTPQCSGECIAITLGAAVWTDKPSPVFRERINQSIKLYQADIAQTLLFTGGLAEGDKISEAQAAKEQALNSGVSSEDIILEEQSSNTQENIIYASQLLNRSDYEQVYIVSDPYHLHRALLYSKALNLNAIGVGTTTSRYRSNKEKLKFATKEALQVTKYKLTKLFNLKATI